jgi:hypothetical protein
LCDIDDKGFCSARCDNCNHEVKRKVSEFEAHKGKTSIVNLVNGQVHIAAVFDKCLTHEEVCSELIKLSKNNALKGTVLTICYDAKTDSLWLNDVVIA